MPRAHDKFSGRKPINKHQHTITHAKEKNELMFVIGSSYIYIF